MSFSEKSVHLQSRQIDAVASDLEYIYEEVCEWVKDKGKSIDREESKAYPNESKLELFQEQWRLLYEAEKELEAALSHLRKAATKLATYSAEI